MKHKKGGGCQRDRFKDLYSFAYIFTKIQKYNSAHSRSEYIPMF